MTARNEGLSQSLPVETADVAVKRNISPVPPLLPNGSVQLCPTDEGLPLPARLSQTILSNGSGGLSTGYLRSESGHSIFYSCWRPTGPARGVVLILHGLGEHGGRYRHLIAALVHAGYRVYAHDHQGFGRSGGARGYVHNFHDYLADITQVVSMARQRNPGLPCCLYGHSMGGLLGLLHLMDVPGATDLAVISSPSLQAHNLSFVNRILKQLLIILNRVRPTFTFPQQGSLDIISRDWEEVQLAVKDSLGVRHRSARWVVEFFDTMRQVRERADEICLPILMMQGLADAAVMPAATQAFFAHIASTDKALRLYEGYYHELHNDLGREKPIGAVIDWLDARCKYPSHP